MVHSISCKSQIETVRKSISLFSSKNTGIGVYIREDGKYDSKKCTKKIKFPFAIYAVKAEVIVGCFVAFILSFSLLPFTRSHSIFYHSVLQ